MQRYQIRIFIILARNQCIFQCTRKKIKWKQIIIFICPNTIRVVLIGNPAPIRCFEPSLICTIFLQAIFDPYFFSLIKKTSSYRNRHGSFLPKIYFEPIESTALYVPRFTNNPRFPSNGKSHLEGVRLASPRSPVMSDFVEAAEIVRFFLEIRNTLPVGNVPQRPNHRHERGLPRAVLADEQGQGRQAGRLLFAEAAEVLQGDLVHGIWCSVTLVPPVAWNPPSIFQRRSKGTRRARCLQAVTTGKRGCSPVRLQQTFVWIAPS